MVYTYQWYGEDHVVVGFSSGVVSLISVKPETMGQEQSSLVVGNGPIDAIALCHDLQKLSIA